MLSAPTPRIARFSLATALSLAAVGCGGGGESVDTATVTIAEPGSAAVSAPTGAGTTESTPATVATAPADTTAVKAEGFGTLKGKVLFAGDPPVPKMLVPKGDTAVKDGAVCAAEPVPSQRLVVDPETKGVKWAIVYIPKPTAVSPEAESAAKAATIEFDQKGCMFDPHVLAVMKGTTVTLKSSDPVGHNVNSQLINTKFNTSVQPGSGPIPVDAKAAETKPGSVVCDIHPWMKAWWMVTNSPYFAVTDEKGEYTLNNVPAGTQKVVVWQEAVQPAFVTPGSGEPVTIKADAETEKDFTIKTDQIKPEA